MINFKKLISIFITFAWLIMSPLVHASDLNSPIGFWKTIDDVTGKPKSILKIVEMPDRTLQAQVMKIYPSPGKDEHELCTACQGANHNKPIVGMVILWGMTQQDDHWGGGRILDPKNGKIYKCNLKVMNGGREMDVHGYIGISLIGRSQTWLRVEGVH